MSTTTTNYGLTKPEKSDNYNVDVMGNNMDKIDSAIKAQDTRIKAVENEVNGALSCTSVSATNVTATTGTFTNLSVSEVKFTPGTAVSIEQYGYYTPTIIVPLYSSHIPASGTLKARGYTSSTTQTCYAYLYYVVNGVSNRVSLTNTLTTYTISKATCIYLHVENNGQGTTAYLQYTPLKF